MKISELRKSIRISSVAVIVGLSFPVSAVEINAGDVEASIYGFARLNVSYDLDDNRAVSTRAGTFSPADQDITGHFGADVQQSRLGVRVNHASGLKVVVEGDFRGSGNSAGSLRMRHAYGVYEGVMIGRNWSNFNSFVGWTPTLDFDSLAGNAGSFNRSEQVRYTTGPVSVALENPSATIIGGNAKTGTPALTARVESASGSLKYSFAGLVNQLSSDDGTTDESQLAYGFFGAAGFSVTDSVSIQGAFTYTDGASSYLWRSGSNYYGASAYMNGDSLETISGYGSQVGVSIDVGGGSSVKLGYGLARLDLDDAVSDGALTGADAETNQNAFVNYTWTPVESVMLGVEYGFFDQETQAGDSSDARRLLFAAQYNF
ncbi:DcaP family trimeric outer membrane transporter [Marinobacter confluentis]|uniref:Porin n=1 Tax=Marinobacter confluentis TaxID=1697557 RepID=A0A4Z1C4S5_9GAMM|nr:DcaP family trimeric outer membrane transporter [Marinobacter confluentis]TGN38072.1 hypothetical protein E5Q11_16995 [Marinobacter confluentis]